MTDRKIVVVGNQSQPIAEALEALDKEMADSGTQTVVFVIESSTHKAPELEPALLAELSKPKDKRSKRENNRKRAQGGKRSGFGSKPRGKGRI